jgi:hypothetical protein
LRHFFDDIWLAYRTCWSKNGAKNHQKDIAQIEELNLRFGISGYTCIEKVLEVDCALIKGNIGYASCALDFVNKATGACSPTSLILEVMVSWGN